MSVLLLAGLAGSQEPTAPTQPMNPPIRVNRPRAQRVPSTSPHVPDPWYPDPPPEGAVVTPSPQPVTAPMGTSTSPAATTPGPQPASAQPPAVPPSTDEQLPPPTPPQVAYRNGLLTVRALNSTLESVLNAIRNKAGIQFEGLEGGASERVVISMGPSPEGEVLATILGGSHFDYIVVDRVDSPGIVQRVLLTPRQGGAAASASGTPRPSAPAMSTGDDEENADEGSAEAESPQDTPARPPIMQAQPQMQVNPPPPQPQPNQQPTGPKTPEQLLEELKQMQQRQQEQQQPQQPAPQKPPPL
jgi:hypothetical protein